MVGREEITGQRKNNYELYNLYSSPNIVKVRYKADVRVLGNDVYVLFT